MPRALCLHMVNQELSISGADATDAYIATSVLEADTELIAADRGFRRFPGVKLRNPHE